MEIDYIECCDCLDGMKKLPDESIDLVVTSPLKDRINKWYETVVHGTSRNTDGTTFRKSNDKKNNVQQYGARFNVWDLPTEKNNTTWHPAPFPFNLAKDHIKSWSNEGDVVLDIFLGSGTTADACIQTKRHYIGFEISPEYYEIAKQRIKDSKKIAKQITFDDII